MYPERLRKHLVWRAITGLAIGAGFLAATGSVVRALICAVTVVSASLLSLFARNTLRPEWKVRVVWALAWAGWAGVVYWVLFFPLTFGGIREGLIFAGYMLPVTLATAFFSLQRHAVTAPSY